MRKVLVAFLIAGLVASITARSALAQDKPKTPMPSPEELDKSKKKQMDGDMFSTGLFNSFETHSESSFACFPLHNEARQNQNSVSQVVGKLTETVNIVGLINNAILSIAATGGELAGDDRNELSPCVFDGQGRTIEQGIKRVESTPDTKPTVVTETLEEGKTRTEIYGSFYQTVAADTE